MNHAECLSQGISFPKRKAACLAVQPRDWPALPFCTFFSFTVRPSIHHKHNRSMFTETSVKPLEICGRVCLKYLTMEHGTRRVLIDGMAAVPKG